MFHVVPLVHTGVSVYILYWHVYTSVYLCVLISINDHNRVFIHALCVCVCVWGRKCGIAQHRLVTALDTGALFFNRVITSCLASATQRREKPCAHIGVCSCGGVTCTSALPLGVKGGKLGLICLCVVLQGFPSFTCDYGKIQQPLTAWPKHRSLLESYSIFVIQQKRLASEPASTRFQSRSHSLQGQDYGFFRRIVPFYATIKKLLTSVVVKMI